MPATITFGLSSIGTGIGDYLDKFSFKKAIENVERRKTNGVFGPVKTFNPTNTFDIEGGGDLAIAVGTGSLTSISQMASGVHIIMGSERSEGNNDFDSSKANGKHYPSGSIA